MKGWNSRITGSHLSDYIHIYRGYSPCYWFITTPSLCLPISIKDNPPTPKNKQTQRHLQNTSGRQSRWTVCNAWQREGVGLLRWSVACLPSKINLCLGLWKFNYCVAQPLLMLRSSSCKGGEISTVQNEWSCMRQQEANSIFTLVSGQT